jgi:hypothetical protein
MMYPIMHGDHVAFYYSEKPERGKPIEQKLAVLNDGSQPQAGTPVLCGFCGKHVAPEELEPAGGFA